MIEIRDKSLLNQIYAHCDRIILKTANLNYKQFSESIDTVEIVCFNIFQIGELAKKLSNDFIYNYNEIPWKHIKGMRDKIGHGYDSINYEIVWDTCTVSIVMLKNYINKVLKEQNL